MTLTAIQRHDRMVTKLVRETPEYAALRQAERRHLNEQYVYFAQIQSPDGYIKIGYSSNPIGRVKQLSLQAPYPFVLLGWDHGGHAEEQRLHRTFATFRAHGEWFLPTPDLMAHIAANAKQTPPAPKARRSDAEFRELQRAARKLWNLHGRTPTN